jgi:hypothetical protein
MPNYTEVNKQEDVGRPTSYQTNPHASTGSIQMTAPSHRSVQFAEPHVSMEHQLELGGLEETKDYNAEQVNIDLSLSTLSTTSAPEFAHHPSRINRIPTYTPTAPDNAPTVLTFDKLTVTTRKSKPPKVLLHGVTGQIAGGFYAIMGASGEFFFFLSLNFILVTPFLRFWKDDSLEYSLPSHR